MRKLFAIFHIILLAVTLVCTTDVAAKRDIEKIFYTEKGDS